MSPAPMRSIEDRLLEKLAFADQWYDNGITRTRCLVWTKSLVQGYGKIRLGKATQGSVGAHRLAYERWVGAIPDGMQVDHLCHNADEACQGGYACPHRACVNPAHLGLKTLAENVLAGKGRTAKQARAATCKNGHPWDEKNTWYRPTGGRSCRACANANSKRYDKAKRAGIRESRKGQPGYSQTGKRLSAMCRNGERPWTEESTLWVDGRRACRLCRKAWWAANGARYKNRASAEPAELSL